MTELMNSSDFLLPNQDELAFLLDLTTKSTDFEIFFESLLNPIEDFLLNGGKKLRSEILEIGFLFSGGQLNPNQQKKLDLCAQVIEGLHAGSMIIDDIQDQSDVRRGNPTLHRKTGMAVALNAGNWLYFQALAQIKKLNFDPKYELHLWQYLNTIILRAHFGQAADVGVSMHTLPKGKVNAVCLTTMELKTGSLMALSFDLGAFCVSHGPLPTPLGSKFAKEFGIALQMFDDIGNFKSHPPKGKEDLRNGRPSFIWAVASMLTKESDYRRFIEATQMLPDESCLNSWERLFNLTEEAKKIASKYLWNLLDLYSFSPSVRDRIEHLFIKLEGTYV